MVQSILNPRRLICELHFFCLETLKDSFSLPPKRLLSTAFIPSAWVDDTLIKERKAGLTQYLTNLLQSPDYKDNPAIVDFLTPKGTKSLSKFDLEDAVPSTLSRKTALNLEAQGDVEIEATMIAAAYYPDWSAGSFPPEKLDFSKFDILFFGTS